jgi:hypothetical protein
MSLKVLLGRASSCGEIVLRQLRGRERLPGPDVSTRAGFTRQ